MFQLQLNRDYSMKLFLPKQNWASTFPHLHILLIHEKEMIHDNLDFLRPDSRVVCTYTSTHSGLKRRIAPGLCIPTRDQVLGVDFIGWYVLCVLENAIFKGKRCKAEDRLGHRLDDVYLSKVRCTHFLRPVLCPPFSFPVQNPCCHVFYLEAIAREGVVVFFL